jgi:hypothetical protein
MIRSDNKRLENANYIICLLFCVGRTSVLQLYALLKDQFRSVCLNQWILHIYMKTIKWPAGFFTHIIKCNVSCMLAHGLASVGCLDVDGRMWASIFLSWDSRGGRRRRGPRSGGHGLHVWTCNDVFRRRLAAWRGMIFFPRVTTSTIWRYVFVRRRRLLQLVHTVFPQIWCRFRFGNNSQVYWTELGFFKWGSGNGWAVEQKPTVKLWVPVKPTRPNKRLENANYIISSRFVGHSNVLHKGSISVSFFSGFCTLKTNRWQGGGKVWFRVGHGLFRRSTYVG